MKHNCEIDIGYENSQLFTTNNRDLFLLNWIPPFGLNNKFSRNCDFFLTDITSHHYIQFSLLCNTIQKFISRIYVGYVCVCVCIFFCSLLILILHSMLFRRISFCISLLTQRTHYQFKSKSNGCHVNGTNHHINISSILYTPIIKNAKQHSFTLTNARHNVHSSRISIEFFTFSVIISNGFCTRNKSNVEPGGTRFDSVCSGSN